MESIRSGRAPRQDEPRGRGKIADSVLQVGGNAAIDVIFAIGRVGGRGQTANLE